jgi:hypothetical protein
LVIEARAQLSFGVKQVLFSMDEYNQDDESNQYFNAGFSFSDIGHGPGANFGLTLRYGFIGLAVDYSVSNIQVYHTAQEPGMSEMEGKEKFPFKSLECKLSFTF